MDISKATFKAAAQAVTKQYEYRDIRNTSESIRAYLSGLDPSNTHLVMEYTGNYELALACEAYAQGFKVSIVPGSKIRHFSKMRGVSAKTDKQDAKMIHQYAQAEIERLPLFKPSCPNISAIKQLRRHLDNLNEQKRVLTSRLESLQLHPHANTFVINSIEQNLVFLDEQLVQTRTELQAMMGSNKELPSLNMIKSVPGVGPVLAQEFSLFAQVFDGFNQENIPKMIKLMGLAPANNESGTIRGKRSIVKGGYTRLKKALYMGTVACVTRKKAQNPFKDYYLKLRALGKSFKAAIVAVMAKIARVTVTIMIKHEKYDMVKHLVGLPK